MCFFWNPLWKCVSLWLSKSFGRYANIENNNDDDGDGDGDGDGDISTILVLKNT